jgi:nitrogen-specific signal transduction histidine kinase
MEKRRSTFKPAPSDREFSNQIFEYANLGLARTDFLQEISKMLMSFSGCDAVELWLEEGGIQARCEAARQPKKSFRFNLIRGVKKKKGKVVPLLQNNSSLERFCWNVLTGEVNFSPLAFIRKDVFWILDLPKGEKDSYEDFYRSLALTLLKFGAKKIGLLILKSGQGDFFPGKDMATFGKIARNLGMALMNQRAQAALQERIKELTCLYQIAQIMDRPDTPLEEILQSLADALPPAWQYPEIASSRILFDNFQYTAPRFRESPYHQSTDLIVRGKQRGSIEVIYTKAKPELYEGPFLKEERNLLDTIGRQVALFIEKREAAEEKDLLEEQLRHADRLATVGKLAAGMAHELNEPLGSILGFAQLAKKCSGLPKQAAQDMERIISASLHAREVIKKLMLFARQMPPRKTRLDLNQVVREGLYLFEARCARQGIDLILSLSPELPEVHADATQLTQVLTNLVVNAMQAMPKGGKLSVQTLGGNDSISLIIEDTGEGMSKEVLEQIFIPFFTTKDIDQGTGLGLAVVHGIVTAHKGSIKVDSQLGQGSRFEIRLPGATNGGENN